MSNLGKYCKAYPLQLLRQFSGWAEDARNARKTRKEIEGETQEVEKELTETDYLYLQENFTVTDGIFIDEHIIFKDVTPEWIQFCQNTLDFQVPGNEESLEKESSSQTSNSN
jgi:hypothetical protein